jgi:hypothetical protein
MNYGQPAPPSPTPVTSEEFDEYMFAFHDFAATRGITTVAGRAMCGWLLAIHRSQWRGDGDWHSLTEL